MQTIALANNKQRRGEIPRNKEGKMRDQYYRDTKNALNQFIGGFDGTDGIFSDHISSVIKDLTNEVELILDEYEKKLEIIYQLEQKIEEMCCDESSR
jgi:hypothetical protein